MSVTYKFENYVYKKDGMFPSVVLRVVKGGTPRTAGRLGSFSVDRASTIEALNYEVVMRIRNRPLGNSRVAPYDVYEILLATEPETNEWGEVCP